MLDRFIMKDSERLPQEYGDSTEANRVKNGVTTLLKCAGIHAVLPYPKVSQPHFDFAFPGRPVVTRWTRHADRI
ncbi:predicted protein [Uncinocarpus reesii 1704]|uniref:Uncharacterized protein n=1 Tax=Uncinocarpus reesii (strain UAMH 1704) TaxID=336963 RepID=C4JDY6_UNCRE|nr:uncharacterized protein UREG_00410 [Uncinocarpus reesii 1704]EEP75564.1 predicted protein [Uncinocarpus reesii 1704]